MSDRVKYRPFTGDGQTSVELRDAPLELVLCQVRWPEMSFLQDDQLRPLAMRFGHALSQEYPIFSEAKEVNYVIGPEGVTQNVVGSVYQWVSVDEAWHISLAKRFVTIFSTKYTNYAEFDRRLRVAMEQVKALLEVQVIERIGIRYVNRLSDEGIMGTLSELVRPEVLGYLALPTAVGDVALRSSTNQANYSVGDANLQVRSGVLPPGETVDPAVPALNVASWVLDLDASSEGRRPLHLDEISGRASHLSDIAYDYFKFVTTQGFIDRFGGRP